MFLSRFEIMQLLVQIPNRFLMRRLAGFGRGSCDFITSLDGRIAIPHASRPVLTIPGQITNERDWRLFQ